MDSYRSCIHEVPKAAGPQSIEARHVQYSQRYQKVSLVSPDTSIKFACVGFRRVRPKTTINGRFKCSDEILNNIWEDGVRTLDMCTVRQGETRPAWDVMDEGTRVHPGHWAPCRQGTWWSDNTVTFEVNIEQKGASWGVHMVANGLVLCLDADTRTLTAFEGLANQPSMLPVFSRGSWPLPPRLDISGWFSVTTIARGESVTVLIGAERIADMTGISIKSILAGELVNAGSFALGGPEGWISIYRNIVVTDSSGHELYRNSMTAPETDRILADFQVGTNSLACTIDGAKRDRACFGGDVFVMGRSLAYSTADFEAWKGSITLLVSHQTKEGYLGNLSPIQTPEHEDGEEPPPSYAFYSLTYALLLVVSIKEYWVHSGDDELRDTCWHKAERLMRFVEKFTNTAALIEAPPHLQSTFLDIRPSQFSLVYVNKLANTFLLVTWFPMGGPVIGLSAGLNLAYHDALKSMADMCRGETTRLQYLSKADLVKESLVTHLWDENLGFMQMGSSLPAGGFCQDVNAYALTQGLLPASDKVMDRLSGFPSKLPPAFQGLAHWDNAGVASPYASGFAVEALFSAGRGRAALELLRVVWGAMANRSSPDYSGAHWEAMKLDGSPFNHDVSLAHGWSTWPVFLLPRYLAGLHPAAPGWKAIAIEPVLADLDYVHCSLDTVAGRVEVSVTLEVGRLRGEIVAMIPRGTTASIKLPGSWEIVQDAAEIIGTGSHVTRRFRKEARDGSGQHGLGSRDCDSA